MRNHDEGAPGRALVVFDLAGSEAQMGRQHGEMTREIGNFEDTMAFYGRLPIHILGAGRRDPGRTVAVRLLEKALVTGLRRLDDARPAALRERTKAFFAALGRPERERLAVVGLDGAQNAIGLLSRLGLTHSAAAPSRLAFAGACSSFAIWGGSSEDGRLLHARNFDLPGMGLWERGPTLVFCRPDRGLRYGFVATRGADTPGVTAFNEAGLTITAHTRFHREVSFDGLGIVDLGHMIVKQARTIAEAVAIASAHRVASSWALVVSSAQERMAAAIEVHAGRVALDMARPGTSWFAATNRYQVAVMQAGEVAPSAAWIRYSDGRLAAMRRALEVRRGLSATDAMRLLASHEAGDVPGWTRATGDCLGQSISVQSVVVDPERGRIWVSTGDTPTSRGPWAEVPWSWDEGVGLREVDPSLETPAGQALERFEGPDYRTGASGEAYRAYLGAALLESRRSPEGMVQASIEEAVRLAPSDPSFRHLAGGVALRLGEFDRAHDHFEAAIMTEKSQFRLGELRLWASRAAHWAGRDGLAREHRSALGAMNGSETDASKRALSQTLGRRVHREIGVDFQLLTLTR